MAKWISIFDFLRMKHLTQVWDFSPSVESRASVDHFNVLKSHFLVMNLIVKFNGLFKSGPGIKIGQFCVKIQLVSHHKTTEIAISWANRKKLIFNIFIFLDCFLLILVENCLKWNFQWKNVKISKFQFFRFFRKVAILLVLRWKNGYISWRKYDWFRLQGQIWKVH